MRGRTGRVQGARQRVTQFWRGLHARVAADERELVAQILSPEALALFDRMPVDAQRHSLDVLHAVRSTGVRNPDLDAAALLHDVGKLAADEGGVPLGFWLRTPLVLLEAWSPRTLARVASADPAGGWRYTAYVHREHPRIGAEWAVRAACGSLTCWLIRHHQDGLASLEATGAGEPDLQLLRVLQAADSSC